MFMAAELRYWEKMLADLPAPMHLARHTPASYDNRGDWLAVQWPAALHHRIIQLAHE